MGEKGFKFRKRKIARFAKGSYWITLPMLWIRNFGLDKGSEVELILEEDGCLRVIPIKT